MDLAVERGALRESPAWNDHKRAKNWAAVIELDPGSPGGVRREFLPRGGGGYLYRLAGLVAVGDPIEFGADYYSGSGRQHRDRWYGVVVAMSPTELSLREYDTARKAVLHSRRRAK